MQNEVKRGNYYENQTAINKLEELIQQIPINTCQAYPAYEAFCCHFPAGKLL